jgi:hypothetical protein
MSGEIRELRLRYSVDGMVALIEMFDHMKLGELPEPVALFIAHASNAANWHPWEEES